MPFNIVKMLSWGLFFIIYCLAVQNVPSLQAADCSLQLEKLSELKGLVKRQAFLQKAVQECPDDARINYYFGYNLERLRKYEQSIQYYEKAVSLDPQFAKSYFGLGDVYLLLGNNKSAIKAFEKGLTLEPDNIWALRSFQKAKDMIAQTIISPPGQERVSVSQQTSPPALPQEEIRPVAVDELVDVEVKNEKLPQQAAVPVKKSDENEGVPEKVVENETMIQSAANEAVEDDAMTAESFVQRMSDGPVQSEDSRGAVLQMQIQFMISSGELTDDAKRKLDNIVCQALKSEELRAEHFEVAGHTDNSGYFELNMTLSKKRAESVKKYLVEQCNISPARLTTVYFGQTRPSVPNSTIKNRQLNRRVEFRRLQKNEN